MTRAKQNNYKLPTGRAQRREGSGRKTQKIADSSSRVKLKKSHSPVNRFRTKAVQLIRRSQKSTKMLIPQKSFQRMVTKISLHDPDERLRFQLPACLALQEATEIYLLGLCEDWQLCAFHAKRVSVVSSDIHLVRCLRRERV